MGVSGGCPLTGLSDFAPPLSARVTTGTAQRPPLNVARHPLNDGAAATPAQRRGPRRHDARQGELFPVDGEAAWSVLGVRGSDIGRARHPYQARAAVASQSILACGR